MRLILRLCLLLWLAPALAHVPSLHMVAPVITGAVVSKDIVVYQGQKFDSLLAAPDLETSGRGLRAHIRSATPTATVIQILTYNGSASARVAFATGGVQMTIGAAVSSLWLVNADRVEWVYDVESYSLSDTEDVLQVLRGKVVVYGNRTRESDVTPSAQMPSGDGRYVRFDTDAQGLSDAQKLAARTNIGAGTGGGGGSGDVVGPASVTDDRIAAFDTTTGKLIKQGSVTATAVASHLSDTSNPHSVTAAQVGADPAGTAASAVSAHAALTETHGISTYGASLVNDADAATARSTLGLGTAATSATGDFEAAGSIATHAALTTSVHGITAAGAALIDDTSASAQRTTMGVAIGSDVQAYDADLTTWAGVTPGTGVASWLATPSSANLATALTDETGSGGAVFASSPTLTTPALGTPSALVLANATGLPLATGVSGQLPLANGGTGAALTDPNADRIAFWDDSAGAVTWLTAGTGLTITGTTIDAAGGGSGDVVGPSSATDNAIARFDATTGKLLQNSGVTVSDVSGSSVTVASTAGNALALTATAPAATTGASQAGKDLTIEATDAVASTDTAGAAAGGSVWVLAKDAKRNTSGNANGGNIYLTTGAGIGTGTAGQVIVGAGSAAKPAISSSADAIKNTGIYFHMDDYVSFSVGGAAFAHMATNEGGFTLLGNGLVGWRSRVAAKTSSASEATVDLNGVLTNEGATALITRTITASAGTRYTYVVQDADGIRVQAASGDTIRVMDKVTAAAGYIESTTIGSVVELLAINSTEFVAVSIHGVWTDGTFSYDDTSLTTP